MNKKLYLSLAFGLVSIVSFGQAASQDSNTKASQIVKKNSGEKNLGKELKQNQLKTMPQVLAADSTSGVHSRKHAPGKCIKRRKTS